MEEKNEELIFQDELAQTLHKAVLGEPEQDPVMSAACRKAACDGLVLLKNEGVLPLDKQSSTAYFGRVQNDYFYVGYGSGGDVNPNYLVSPMAALRDRGDIAYDQELAGLYADWCACHVPQVCDWAQWPTCHPEMPLRDDQVRRAAQKSETAVVILGRAMGESMDNSAIKGGYYLTDEEQGLLEQVTREFKKTVVVIDAGNIIDLSWTREYDLQAVLYAFQGGMESGNGVIDVLYGDAEPGGKLTDTIPAHYEDAPTYGNFGGLDQNTYAEDIYVGYRYYETFAPEKVLYPFGFGLSYTTFRLETRGRMEGDCLVLDVTVGNTGARPGREVVQVYAQPPQGQLGKPLRNLVAFRKTGRLAPGETQTLSFRIAPEELASYDDSGVTGNPHAYVLEAGEYTLYVGTDVRTAEPAFSWKLEQLRVVRQLRALASPTADFKRLRPKAQGEGFVPEYEPVPRASSHRKADILAKMPREIPFTGDKGIRFRDVCAGKAGMDAFVAQLTPEELDAITRGEGEMDSPFGAKGNAGMLGGTSQVLRDKGVPTITTTDGPSGIRVCYYTALLPCGTALASAWDPEATEALGRLFGQEMEKKGSDILLGPGLNIHRDPLCGRNFEYCSEDPLLSGKMAAAMVRGIQSVKGRSACPKHFACNNQETNRAHNDSRLSMRALREIYLRGFEICVKESAPLTLMTSYNQINGVWGHYQYELVTNILREEWGFDGLVMTDWWMQPCGDPDFPSLRNDAYRVRAQVDVLMPGGVGFGRGEGDGSLLESYRAEDGITLAEMQRSAKNVLTLCARLKG